MKTNLWESIVKLALFVQGRIHDLQSNQSSGSMNDETKR